MPIRPLPLFSFSTFIVPAAPPVRRRPIATASGRLRRLLAAASANDMPDANERALVLDLHAHLRRIAHADR
ncbi:MAG TPA: hypothetical protein VLF18_22185 [Tahibacter sp.]|uniref:hypothetical protein n=1 Tax=Tahibacter sp. TaxID=2056211 RepID=UPI002C2848E5|nr:hypothetical protein [Tahibacter sp.]HSX62903.1 hypothetical protein [Tahibacter sp.]